MLLQSDVKGLEIVCAAYLSQDPVLMKELDDGVDIHSTNQEAFGLPSRLIAKVLKFRTIYGGSAYSFSEDPEFASVGYNERQWQEVLDTYYRKYAGLKQWHKKIVEEVVATGRLVTPCTGRAFDFAPINGKFPEPSIKNYPVQGLGADIVAIARVSLWNRLKKLRNQDKRWERVLLVNTIHDSIIVDLPEEMVEETHQLLLAVFRVLPKNFEKLFNVPFNLEVNVENLAGQHWGDLKEIGK